MTSSGSSTLFREVPDVEDLVDLVQVFEVFDVEDLEDGVLEAEVIEDDAHC